MISFFFIFMISFLITSAQEAFNYQGLARDGEGEPLSNKEIAVQISIHSSGESGEVVYRERHYPITSERGLFSIRVGMGIHEFGSFENIDWGSSTVFSETMNHCNILGLHVHVLSQSFDLDRPEDISRAPASSW